MPEIKYDSAGLPYLYNDGPVHRFHPLIEEDCSKCLAERLRINKVCSLDDKKSVPLIDGVLLMESVLLINVCSLSFSLSLSLSLSLSKLGYAGENVP